MSENDRLGPPPVEPLSDLAWSRIERGLWSRMDATELVERAPRSRRWMWIAAPALTAAAAAAVIAIGVGGKGANGEGAVGERTNVETAMRLVSGAAPSSASHGDVHLELDAHSAVVLEPARSAVLERGAAWFTVAPRGERAPFVVTAGDTVVRVVGTKFRVARSGEEAAVRVEHGTVEVHFRGARARVGAGEEWRSQQPTTVTPIRVAQMEPEARAARPTRPEPAAAATAPEPASSSAPKPASRPDHAVSAVRTAPLPAPAPTSRPEVEEPAAADKPAADKPAADKPSAAEKAAQDADLARYRQLEQLEVRNPKAAIDGYLELARSSSRWAERALFAAARLSADRREPRARRLLEIYLTRFPGGANVDDARKLLDHIPGAQR